MPAASRHVKDVADDGQVDELMVSPNKKSQLGRLQHRKSVRRAEKVGQRRRWRLRRLRRLRRHL